MLRTKDTALQGKNLQVLYQNAGVRHRRDFRSIMQYFSFSVIESQETESRDFVIISSFQKVFGVQVCYGHKPALPKPEGVPPMGGIKAPLVPPQVQHGGWQVRTPQYFTYPAH